MFVGIQGLENQARGDSGHVSRQIIFGINITLDGICDHTAMIADDDLHEYFTGLLQRVDVVVFGRETYNLMYPFWAEVAKNSSGTEVINEFARTFDSLDRIVFSRTMTTVEWKNTIISRGDPREEILKLKGQNGKHISISSITIACRLMQYGLIDEYHFVVHPILAGSGRRLFNADGLRDMLQLRLVESRTLSSGAIALHYRKS